VDLQPLPILYTWCLESSMLSIYYSGAISYILVFQFKI